MENYFFKERSEKLCDVLVPHLFTGLHDLFRRAKELNYELGRTQDKTLMTFQLCLKRIPQLPGYQLEKDYDQLAYRLKQNGFPPDWLQKIITDIFMAYGKSHLISLGANEKIKIRKIDLSIPENTTFIHKCYVECARCFWQEPYLFSDNYSTLEVQRNQVLAQQKIKDCVYKTIRTLVPLEQLASIYHVGFSESSTNRGTEIDIDLPDRERSIEVRGRDISRSRLQRMLDSEAVSDQDSESSHHQQHGGRDGVKVQEPDRRPEYRVKKEEPHYSDHDHDGPQHSSSRSDKHYSKLNRENLDKLQRELAKNTLVTRTKTMSTVSTAKPNNSVVELIKQANQKIKEVKGGGDKYHTEIGRHLDKKMGSETNRHQTTNDEQAESEIKTITIKDKRDLYQETQSGGQSQNDQVQQQQEKSDTATIDTNINTTAKEKAKRLARVKELLGETDTVKTNQTKNTSSSRRTNEKTSNEKTKDEKTKDDETKTTIEIQLTNNTDKIDREEGDKKKDEVKAAIKIEIETDAEVKTKTDDASDTDTNADDRNILERSGVSSVSTADSTENDNNQEQSGGEIDEDEDLVAEEQLLEANDNNDTKSSNQSGGDRNDNDSSNGGTEENDSVSRNNEKDLEYLDTLTTWTDSDTMTKATLDTTTTSLIGDDDRSVILDILGTNRLYKLLGNKGDSIRSKTNSKQITKAIHNLGPQSEFSSLDLEQTKTNITTGSNGNIMNPNKKIKL